MSTTTSTTQPSPTSLLWAASPSSNAADLLISTIQLRPASFQLIDELPPELVLEISSWLPSSAALALCNHKLFALLGRSSLAVLDSNPLERERFLLALCRDIVDTFFCFSCKKIHFFMRKSWGQGSKGALLWIFWKKLRSILPDRGQSNTAALRFSRTSNSRCRAPRGTMDYYFKRGHFTIEHAQVAVNLSRQNLSSDADRYLGCASITQPLLRLIGVVPDNWGFRLFEALFVRNRVCTRSQTWMFVSRFRGYALPTLLTAICDHFNSSRREEDRFSSLLLCNLIHLRDDEDRCVKCSWILSCPICCLDVQINKKVVESDPNFQMVIITKWQYMAIDSAPIVVRDSEGDSTLEFGPGEIRDAYEEVTDTPYKSILGLGEAWRYMKSSGVLTRQ